MTKFTSPFIWLFAIVLLVAGAALLFLRNTGEDTILPVPTSTPSIAITSFEECAAAGYPIMESYPPRCAVPGGPSFTQDIGNELEKMDLIRLEQPRPQTTIASPLVVKGEARGTWFFEASFPVRLEDANGNVLVQSFAQAQGEWMTEEFVPFQTELTFPTSQTETGTLILEKDNPSGLPEHADELRVPVRF